MRVKKKTLVEAQRRLSTQKNDGLLAICEIQITSLVTKEIML